MIFSIGADHGGVEIRNHLIKKLEKINHQVIDHGTFNEESVDYPDFAALVGEDVASGEADFGIVICKTGIGIGISANKVPGIRAATIHFEEDARLSRSHNDANVIAFGSMHSTPEEAANLLDIFIATTFEGGRHSRRVDKIDALDKLI